MSLVFTLDEFAPKNTVTLYTADDTSFIMAYTNENTVHCEFGGQKLPLEQWGIDLKHGNIFENAYYFLTQSNEIWKAELLPSRELRMGLVRTVRAMFPEEEAYERGLMFSTVRDGRKYAYLLCDDPNDGIEVDVDEEEEDMGELLFIHRHKLIYRKKVNGFQGVSARNVSKNIICITTSASRSTEAKTRINTPH
ncbi:hypothetical protein PFISCL1PPCAC_17214 [Pristionchus fissidentatus]|uniref:Uncharacterized protein n=1 Tax=Pristionchus fissidentatus TaxID=1538716 RepID=A0AAV5W761_9BILA|nr:hypothetical protein PFISCL1PPCAC_17214 [Pristionchus fissidentatus]